MKKITKILTSSTFSVVAFGLAIALLCYGAVGGAKAAITYYSETYVSLVETKDIGVTLLEDGEPIAYRDYDKKADGTWNEKKGILFADILGKNATGQVVLGEKYDKTLAVKNSGTIDEYVRVTIYKYWEDKDGKKTRDISPEIIQLNLANLSGDETGENCWIEDSASKTMERTVLYYKYPLQTSDITPDFLDSVTIDTNIDANARMMLGENGTLYTSSDVEGYRFVVEVQVNAVQDHNAKEAILSAWGREVTVTDKAISLK